MDKFYLRCKRLIDERGWNQTTFGEKIGVSTSMMSGFLRGGSQPTLDKVEAILSVFPEINTHWLMTGEGSPNLPNSEIPPSQNNISYILDYFNKMEKRVSFLEKEIKTLKSQQTDKQ